MVEDQPLNWDDLNKSQRDDCRTTIMVRWCSMRDHFKNDFNEEVKRPSTSSSTWAPEAPREIPHEAVPEEPSTAGPSPAQAAGQDLNLPLPVLSGDATMDALALLFEALMHRQRSGRSHQADYEDLTRLVYECLMGITNRVAALEDNVRRLQEGAVLTSKMGLVHHYWLSLLPVLERFMPDQLFEVKRQVDSVLWKVQHRPRPIPRLCLIPHPTPIPH